MDFTLALTGDANINRRISVCTEKRFLEMVELLRGVDVAFTHLETTLHDYDGPAIYPSAEAGWKWQRGPRYVAEELRWAGFDLVSLASNHSLDYSYGGLFSTWEALAVAGIPHAGTGMNLAQAREPAYLDTAKKRVALISMCSSFASWARAGEARRDVKGRPGLNPLRYYHQVDRETLNAIKALGKRLGWHMIQVDRELLVNPPGVHNTVTRYVEWDHPGTATAVHEDDLEGNLASVRNAKEGADLVIVHVHNHEWNPETDLNDPPVFIRTFGRACIDSGADVFIAQGSHASIRGIEIYKGKPIFYDPGDFLRMGDTITRLPFEYYWHPYWRHVAAPEVFQWSAMPADAVRARAGTPRAFNPPEGHAVVRGALIPICTFDEQNRLCDLKLYPVQAMQKPHAYNGIPALVDHTTAQTILEHVRQLSMPFGTRVEVSDCIGVVALP